MVKNTEQFKEISAEVLRNILTSDSLKTYMKEMQVFDAAKIWIKHNNVIAISDILENVRFGLLTQEEMSEVMCDEIIAENEGCRKIVKDVKDYFENVYSQPLYEGNLNRPRGKTGVFIIEEGPSVDWDDRLDSGDVYLHFLNYPNLEEYKERSLKITVSDFSLKGVQVNNFIFIFGHFTHEHQNFTKRYDVTTNTWLELKGMPCEPLYHSTVAYNNGVIFSIGGFFSKDGFESAEQCDAHDEVHAYDICSNDWKACEKYPAKVTESGACSQGGLLFVSGGRLTNGDPSDQMFAYDMKANHWLPKSSMRYGCNSHVMVTVENQIYVIAGYSEIDYQGRGYVGKYSTITDQWTDIDMPLGRLPNEQLYSVTGGFVAEKKIYILGATRHRHNDKKSSVESPNGVLFIDLEKDIPGLELAEDLEFESKHIECMSFCVTLPELL